MRKMLLDLSRARQVVLHQGLFSLVADEVRKLIKFLSSLAPKRPKGERESEGEGLL
jgi:hypothetical protein